MQSVLAQIKKDLEISHVLERAGKQAKISVVFNQACETNRIVKESRIEKPEVSKRIFGNRAKDLILIAPLFCLFLTGLFFFIWHLAGL